MANAMMLPIDVYERWKEQYTLRGQQVKEVLYPLVNNLWILARQLEKKAATLGEDATIEDLSITATGE